MADEGYELAGAEFEDAPYLDSDGSEDEEDADHEFDGEEEEDDQGVD